MGRVAFPSMDGQQYQRGFGNYFSSEAEPGALPVDRIMPQKCPMGLYAEQLSGSAFTVGRNENQRTWLYRIHPSVGHRQFVPSAPTRSSLRKAEDPGILNPNQLRWGPLALPDSS